MRTLKWTAMSRAALVAGAGLVFAACGSGSAFAVAPDAGSDAGAPDAGPGWGAAVLVDGAAGAGLDLASALDPQGHPAIAYFRKDGPGRYPLILARETAPGTWSTEVVPASLDGGTLTGHYGLGLAFNPDGAPALAYLGGQAADDKSPVDHRWHDFETGDPLPSDAVLARKTSAGWTRQTLGSKSDSFVHTGFAVDDQGSELGLWAGVAFSPDGVAHVIQRDVHFGSDQSATDASNLEYGQFNLAGIIAGESVTSRVSGPAPLIHGGGNYTHLIIVNGQPAVSFALSSDSVSDAVQVWFARRTGAGAWTRTQVSAVRGSPGHGPSLASSATAGFALGILDADQGDLLVATSADGLAWSVNTVEALGETGYHPAVAFGKAGLGVLYAYCRSPIDPAGHCNPSVQELRFRLPGSAGPSGAWLEPEHVDGAVPEATALLTDGSGNYLAVWRDPLLGLRAARRSP